MYILVDFLFDYKEGISNIYTYLPTIPIIMLQIFKQKISNLILHTQLLFKIKDKWLNGLQILML